MKCDKNGQNSPKMEQFSRNSVSTINAYFTSTLPSAIGKIEKIKNRDIYSNKSNYENDDYDNDRRREFHDYINDDYSNNNNIIVDEIPLSSDIENENENENEKSQNRINLTQMTNSDTEFNLDGFDLFTPSILLLVDEIAALESDILSRQADAVTQVIYN